MSPEQARGHNVDKRADIWAFGCVLFEMLTGRVAFAGETASDTIAKILEREPDWSALPAATPARIRRLLVRCLAKDPKQRLRDIGDARIEMDAADDALPRASDETMSSAARRAKTGTTWLPLGRACRARRGCRRYGRPGGRRLFRRVRWPTRSSPASRIGKGPKRARRFRRTGNSWRS